MEGEANQFTEVLENVQDKVKDFNEGESSKMELTYKDLADGSTAVLKILEVSKDTHIAVTIIRDSKKSNAITLDTLDYVVKPGGGSVYEVYDPRNFAKLEAKVREGLLGKLYEEEKKTTPATSPYDSKLSESDRKAKEAEEQNQKMKEETQAERLRLERRGNPHVGGGVGFIPSRIIPPGIGRSDLDPFGGGDPSGMLMDPRGFRGGGIRPPRYDPIGPVPPGGVFGPGGGRGGRAPNFPFGGPTPDHERMPDGFEDMFM